MTRSRQTTMNISNALRTIDRTIVPDDCATEVYYDKVGHCWYAQFVTVATFNSACEFNSGAGHQVGLLGCGFSPLAAVQELMNLNKPKKQGKTLSESSYD